MQSLLPRTERRPLLPLLAVWGTWRFLHLRLSFIVID